MAIPLKFLSPKRHSALWHPVPHLAVVTMPEAPVDEDDLPSTNENEVWAARKPPNVKAIAIPQ
jgi:hypothetical protein